MARGMRVVRAGWLTLVVSLSSHDKVRAAVLG
jgi:hypothetical protein